MDVHDTCTWCISTSLLRERATVALMTGCEASRTMYRIGFEWRQEDPSGNPIRLRARIGQYGEINRSSSRVVKRYRPTGVNRSKACFSVFACMVRLQVSNVPVTRLYDRRRPGPPKLSTKSNHVERGTPVPSPSGQANRKASCWRSGSRSLKKRMPRCNGGDTE